MTRPFESETIFFVENFTSLKQQLEIVWWLNKSTQNFLEEKNQVSFQTASVKIFSSFSLFMLFSFVNFRLIGCYKWTLHFKQNRPLI